jgi:hypothetical protein
MLSAMHKSIFVIALILLITFGTLAQEDNSVSTRFGPLTVSDVGVLLFRDSPIEPKIEANNSLDLGQAYQIGNSDVILLTDIGGTACPATFYFVTVTKAGARVTPGFGTCSDLIKMKRIGDTISVSMPGYRGPTMSRRSQERAARERHTFVYRAGVVYENGRPVK